MINIISTTLFITLLVVIISFLIMEIITDFKELRNLKKYSLKLDLEIEEIKKRIKEMNND